MAIDLTYLVHGTTLDNENNIASGWNDPGLSELGIEQCISLKEILVDRNFDIIYTSDLKRAVETANLLFKEKAQIIYDNRIRECNYGNLNGCQLSEIEKNQSNHISNPFINGESFEDVKERIEDFIYFIKNKYDNRSIAIISHRIPQIALEVLINNKTWEEALANDWRKTGSWQPGWNYQI